MYSDKGNFYDFTSLVRELDVPGELYERKTYPFEFSTVEMPYETYNGVNVRLRYVLKVTINRGYAGSIMEYQDFVVWNYTPPPPINNSIKMEVGIEDCLHIEFEYNKSKYHLKDVIIGKIYFLLVRIKLKNMDLEIRRRESTGSGANTHVETETLAKYELMDGAPVRGESIPIRLFILFSLSGKSFVLLLILEGDWFEGINSWLEPSLKGGMLANRGYSTCLF
ncbi:unnamed protein product [Fraxinus pennsylvanica]|uniref:Uncharacterized protein n=1 Tax=Fraxinus pennsylvanica TaxID=56036 RepID=A0AAD1ZIN6_9LAMI|nr:unnamed protein product [Fraxinus pennsylvanica]